MPSQAELGCTQQYAFFDNPDEGGQLMTRNVPSTQAQRNVVTNRGKKSPFKADVRLVTCVHGKMKKDETILGSLIVLEYHLGCTGGTHRYTSVITKLAFQNQNTKDLKDEPFVKRFAPFQQSKMMDPIEVEHAEKRQAELNLGVGFTPATAGGKLGGENERKYKLDSCAFGQAFPEYTDGKSGSDAIVWEIRENKTKGVGVPDTFRVALLIQRAHSEKFVCSFSLDLHAGIWFAATQTFRKVCGIIEVDDPILFDPSLKSQGETLGISSTDLGEFDNQEILEKLSPIHLV
jgi:hypothetical protein